MRLIEEFEDKSQAQKFSDFLTHRKIDNRVIEDEEISEVWCVYEDQMNDAQKTLIQFKDDHESIDHDAVAKAANKVKKAAEKEAKDGPTYMDARTTILNKGPLTRGALTMLLVLVSVVVAFLSNFGENPDALRALFITDVMRDGARIGWVPGLREVMAGEFWRLLTPMFIHFGIMHLVFNMMWLLDLGSMIEARKGTLFLGVFVMVVSIISNLAQYMVSHPLFGGMSGVVYGLLGYIWMKGKFDPGANLGLHKSTVTMMLVWYVLCLTGLMGNVANAAHTGGLVIGVAWGYLSAKTRSWL
jgi:rhomboid protease GlpG